MNLICFVLIGLFNFQDIPYKPDNEFTIKLDLSFKQRPPAAGNTYNFDETSREYEKRNMPGPTPYLILQVSIDSASHGETKLKIFRKDKKIVLTKKVSKGLQFPLEVGYTDDLKDQMNNSYHVIYFYNSKKKIISQIEITFNKDGDYLVNGVKRGKI